MDFLHFIWAEGMPSADELTVLQREIPAWVQEMDRRGIRRFGRELDLSETAAAVRVRDGQTLVTDGPFAETKEFVAGFDLLDCAGLEEAVEVAAACPISWIQTTEVRPFTDRVELSERAQAFGRADDSPGRPYALIAWIPADASPAADETAAWRKEAQARGLHILGAAIGGADSARTVRVRDGETRVSDGSRSGGPQFIGGIEVVNCLERAQAVELAAAHPVAREHAIEVRPFYVE
jgi:hypothetical protein